MRTASTSHLSHAFQREGSPSEEESRCGPRGILEPSTRGGFPRRVLPRRWPRVRRAMGLSAPPEASPVPTPSIALARSAVPVAGDCTAVAGPSTRDEHVHSFRTTASSSPLMSFWSPSALEASRSDRHRGWSRDPPSDTPGLPHPTPRRLQAFSASWRVVPLHALRPCFVPVTLLGFRLRRFPLTSSCSSVHRALARLPWPVPLPVDPRTLPVIEDDRARSSGSGSGICASHQSVVAAGVTRAPATRASHDLLLFEVSLTSTSTCASSPKASLPPSELSPASLLSWA
jgi:hypothetical protein